MSSDPEIAAKAEAFTQWLVEQLVGSFDVDGDPDPPTRLDGAVWRYYVRHSGRSIVVRVATDVFRHRTISELRGFLVSRPTVSDLILGGAQTIEIDRAGVIRAR